MRTIRGWYEEEPSVAEIESEAGPSTKETLDELSHALLGLISMASDHCMQFRELGWLRTQLSGTRQANFMSFDTPLEISMATMNEVLEALGGLPLDVTDEETSTRHRGRVMRCSYDPDADTWLLDFQQSPLLPRQQMGLSTDMLIGSVLDGLQPVEFSGSTGYYL